METRWLYTTSENFPALCEATGKTCVIPMGCVEKHGLHLPVGTDIIEGSRLAYMASQIEPVCVFPDFIFGDVPGKVPYSLPYGSIALPLETEMLLLEQLCGQIRDNGFEKILVLNAHGGNCSWLAAFSRNLCNKDHDYVFATVYAKLPAPHTMAEILEKNGPGSIPELTPEDEALILKYHAEGMIIGHGCMGETAYIMGIAPESVRLDRLGIESGQDQHVVDHLRKAGIQYESDGWNLNFPNAYGGDDPVGCNERIGKAALRIEAERLAHAFKVFKEDTVLPEWQKKRSWR